MDSYIIIVIIFGLITMGLLCLLYFINNLSLLKNKVERSFIPIKSYIEERSTLLDKMSSFLSNNLEHEEELKKQLETTKTNLNNVNNAVNGILVLKNTEEVFTKFNHLDKIYKNLTRNKEYSELKKEYEENENRINYTIDNYNKEAKKYNNYKKKKIVLSLSKLLHFPEYSYYKNKS